MEQNKDNFSVEEIRKMAQSEAGRQLIAMLQGTDAAKAVRSGAQAGNMADAQRALSAFLSDPKAKALLKKLEEQHHG